MKNIVFDLGKVLIDWQPELAFLSYFSDVGATQAWMHRVGFEEWNRMQDGGRSLADGLAAARVAYGTDARPLDTYTERFPHTIARPVPGTWDLIEQLDASGVPLYAITNWSAENWPAAMTGYPRLRSIFRDIVVSGQEKLLKPDPQIYRLLLQRNGLQAEDCLFIDDSRANVEGAQQVGMHAIHFTGAAALSEALEDLGFLGPRLGPSSADAARSAR